MTLWAFHLRAFAMRIAQHLWPVSFAFTLNRLSLPHSHPRASRQIAAVPKLWDSHFCLNLASVLQCE